ncbi:HAD family hydrolase [Mycobacterium sp. NAZ190054]|uniref:HAD family hydrolase n=1 Tax=Mycobacterium sp. NAZ190054 TaxID=1747766 RepID=UPI0009EBB156|nr:HAD family hydrolase [Mycobacterium sp. NAZ190054]
MQTTEQRAWRAGRFWWDWAPPNGAQTPTIKELRAVIFDLGAVADLENEGHRPAFNKAFAELGLNIQWSPARYRQLLALPDERRRVAAELRKRGVSTECDVLAELLVDEICATKTMILEETVLDADITARPGMAELIAEAYGAGVGVGLVSTGSHTWVEPLVRQLVGDGVVNATVTTDDAPRGELYRTACAELGAPAHDCLAFAGSQESRRTAVAAGMATILIDGDDVTGAPLCMADCRRVHDSWHDMQPRPTAA